MENKYNIDALIKARIAIDDTMKAAQDRLDEELKPKRRKLEVLDGYILTAINETEKQKNIKGDNGTAFKENKPSFTVKDKMVFLQWIAANNRYDLLDAKVHIPTAKKYLEQTQGHLPDGISHNAFTLVRFRRPTTPAIPSID